VTEQFSQKVDETKDLFSLVTLGISTQLNESLHARKAKTACKEIARQRSWPARVAATVMDINSPGWRLELYHQLGLPKLTPEAEKSKRHHDKQITERAAKPQQPTEKRKRNLARMLRRNYSATQNPQYKGITKTTAKKTGDAITHRTLDDTLTATFPPQGENPSHDDESDYQLPANNEEEEEEEDEQNTAAVDQRRIGAESSDDDDDPTSYQLRHQVCQMLTDAEKWENDDDEPFVVQPWHRLDEIDLCDP
jgi:hypothetical protein